jgi:hypothetical protein
MRVFVVYGAGDNGASGCSEPMGIYSTKELADQAVAAFEKSRPTWDWIGYDEIEIDSLPQTT